MPKEVYNVNWPGWEIVRKIGSGSFGTVYEIQRDVYGDVEKAALKVISIPHNEDEVDYLRCTGLDDASITQTFHQQVGDIAREYKLMAQMRDNPNIVHCEDFRDIQHDNGLGWDIYIKMELLTPLMKCLEKVATEDQVIQMGKDICNALIACQEKNIIHRDIKPQNIFLSPKGQFKLGDFGIARTMERTTQATAGIGTYSYMAPEVRNNKSYGKTADIYSLGLMMYWLLNERRGPFMPLPPAVPKYDDEEKARQRRFSGEDMPAPVHGSDEIKRIILKACSYNPEERYTSAAAMLTDLNKLSGGMVAASSVVILDDNTDEKQEDDKTTGPVFGGIKKESSKDSVAIDLDATVGPTFVVKQPPVKEPKTETPKAETVDVKGEKEKKSFLKYILIALGVVVLLVLFLLLRSCGENGQVAEPSEGTTSTQATEGNTATPEQLVWSDWVDKLPEGVTVDKYDIEERTLYSSRTQETTSSTETNSMDGWELFETVEANGEFGPWSDWSTSKVDASATREVENQTRYRYRNKETTTSASSSMDGWELYDTTYSWGDYGSWSNWSAASVSNSDSRQVETKTVYRYRSKEITTGSSENMSGWTLYDTTYSWGNYGAWSDWSTNAVSGSDSRKVETKTQYSYREVSYLTEYTDWSSWSSWQDASVSENDLTKVETRTVWGYYYFKCPSCGAHMYGWGYPCYTWAGGCGYSYIPESAWVQVYKPVSWDEAGLTNFHGTGKYCATIDGERLFKWDSGGTGTEYRYATRSTQQVTNYGNWSEWGDTEYSNSSSREVQTRTIYRYCDRSQIPTYHFYRWGGWSDWSDNGVTATNDRQVETGTFYRYRDRSQIATYHFYRWGSWSDWSDSEITATDDRQIENTTYYRYRDQAQTTTYYFSRWTEWSSYSETAVTPEESVEVQTKIQYRYKAKAN